jgi:cellobiose transport system permease protein
VRRSSALGFLGGNDQIFPGTVVATLPLFVVFPVFGRQVIGGIMEGAVE